MHRPPPPLNFVRSFECAARHLSFTKAADELGYTQAAISTHVRSLERYLGSSLFHRFPRSLALTETGAAFLPTLRQALQMIDQATETVVVGAQNRTVTISCPMSLAENWLARRLAGFNRAYPRVELVVHGTVWHTEPGPASDLVVTMNRDDEVPEGAERLLRERLALLCAPELAAAITGPESLAEMPKIVVLGRQEYWSVFLKDLGVGPPDLSGCLRTNATNIALEMAANGVGLTASPIDLSQTYVDRGLLVEPFDLRPPSPWSYYMVQSGRSLNQAVALARNWILNEAAA